MPLNLGFSAPANPAATASTTLVMAGLGVTLKPVTSGLVVVSFSGVGFTNTAAVSFTVGGRYGTGAPPAQGAAVTGTKFAADQVLQAAILGIGTGFTIGGAVGLTPGTVYWFDLAYLTATAADTAALQNIAAWVLEV